MPNTAGDLVNKTAKIIQCVEEKNKLPQMYGVAIRQMDLCLSLSKGQVYLCLVIMLYVMILVLIKGPFVEDYDVEI